MGNKQGKKGGAGSAAPGDQKKTPGLTSAEFLSSSGPTSPKPREGEEEWEKSNSYMMGYEPARDVLNEKMTIKDFELMKVVGKGSFGKVYQVKHIASGEIYALKSLKKQHLLRRKQIAHTQTERKVLQQIESPFIVNLRFAFQDRDRLYMVLDYFTGGELFYHLKTGGRFGYQRARFYAVEICLALECLHNNDIIYRDLKPENILLDDEGHIRLTDFGLSKDCMIGNQSTKTFCGTPEYLAPEVIVGKSYTKAVDWWSFGTVVYEMTCGLVSSSSRRRRRRRRRRKRANEYTYIHLSPPSLCAPNRTFLPVITKPATKTRALSLPLSLSLTPPSGHQNPSSSSSSFICDFLPLFIIPQPPFYHKNVKAMYERILSAPLRFPRGMPLEGKDFFTKILDRNPKTRLGTKYGARGVKKSPYFSDVNWKKASQKEINPLFVPRGKEGKMDAINVDQEFLNEMPSETPMEGSNLATSAAAEAFPNFTYTDGDNALS